MTRTETIKAKYAASELSHKAALDHLEALGMWRDDAENYLAQASVVTSHHKQDAAT